MEIKYLGEFYQVVSIQIPHENTYVVMFHFRDGLGTNEMRVVTMNRKEFLANVSTTLVGKMEAKINRFEQVLKGGKK